MAHSHRKFDEALKAQGTVDPSQKKSTLAATALKTIQSLYRIERKIKHCEPEEKKAIRQEQSRPLLEDLKTWLDKHVSVVPPKSALGKAMNYMLRQWDKLIVYTTDGRLNIDNNLCENAVRPFVL